MNCYHQTRSINVMGITSNWSPKVAGDKLQHLLIKDMVGMVTMMDTGAKDFQNSLSWQDLWCLLVGHVVSRKEVDGSILNSCLIRLSKKGMGLVNRSLTWITKTDSHSPLADLSCSQNPLNWHVSWEEIPLHCQKPMLLMIPQPSPRGLQRYTRVITLEEKKQIFQNYWTLALKWHLIPWDPLLQETNFRRPISLFSVPIWAVQRQNGS